MTNTSNHQSTMDQDFFLGEIIIESLGEPSCLQTIERFAIKSRTREMPDEKVPFWNIHRYRITRSAILEVAPLIARSFANGEWYVHFFSEQHNELFVIMQGRVFLLPKHRDNSWEEMIAYGETVGVGRRWTQSIPIHLPD
ncbi:MAG: hypothetical protein K9M98_15000 [Cephaloticoccus sp.]|nr:hypothetical protein [Cephaloticoccus sp.]MCF7761806.1 hypothetical protein [Cephaloticoccus sp.]